MKVLQHIFAVLLLGMGLLFSDASAQTRYELTGVVSDEETGETLPGAYVLIKGQQRGTSTDGMGFYKLQLEPGEHTLVATFVGYRPDTVSVIIEPDTDNELDFNLRQEGISGEEILVTADRVVRRVKNLAEMRNEQRKNLKNYSAEVHKLAILYETKEKEKKNGPKEDNENNKVEELSSKVSDDILFSNTNTNDSLQAIAFSERVLEQLFIAPKTYGEKYIARRASENFFSEYDIFSTGGSPLDLNKDKVELNILSEKVTVIGPISTKAGKFYNVEDEPADSTWPENTTRIIVEPKTQRQPLFEGSVYVNDDANRVIGMDLAINKAGEVNSGLYSLSDFRYAQRFEKIEDYWLPVRAQVQGKIGIIGMKNDFIYQDNWTYRDYEINRDDLDKSDIPLSGQIVAQNAGKRDSTFWNNSVTYSRESDVRALEEAFQYSEDRAAVNVGLSLMQYYFKAPTVLRNSYFTNISDFYRFNRVEGHFIGAGLRTPAVNENFTYKAAGGFATNADAQDWRYHFDALQYIPGTSLAVEGSFYRRLAVQFGDYVYDRSPLDIDQFRYDLIAGFSGFDHRNFYERDGYRAGLRYRFRPAFFIRANYMREDHKFTPIVTTKSFFDEFEVGGRVDPNLNENIGQTPTVPVPDGGEELKGFTPGEFSGFEFHAHYDNRQFVREGLFRDYEVRKFGWYTDHLVYWSDPNFGAGEDGFEYIKYRSSFGGRIPAARSHFLLGEIHIGGSNNPLPAQSQIGSNGFIIDRYLRRRPFITLGFNEGIGNRTSVARLDYDFGSSFFRNFPFQFIRQSGMQMRVHATAGYTHEEDGLSPVMPWTDGGEEHVEAGFAVTHIFGMFKVEAAFRLSGDRGESVGFVLIL